MVLFEDINQVLSTCKYTGERRWKKKWAKEKKKEERSTMFKMMSKKRFRKE